MQPWPVVIPGQASGLCGRASPSPMAEELPPGVCQTSLRGANPRGSSTTGGSMSRQEKVDWLVADTMQYQPFGSDPSLIRQEYEQLEQSDLDRQLRLARDFYVATH